MLRTELAEIARALRSAAQRRGLIESSTSGWGVIQRALDQDHPPAPSPAPPDRPASATSSPDRVDADPLAQLTAAFGLNSTERRLLMLAAAADLDPTLGTAFGALLGRVGLQPVTVGLALELAGVPLLSGVGRAMVSPSGPLLRWGLVRATVEPLSLTRTLTVPEDVLSTLVDHPLIDPQAAALSIDVPDVRSWPVTDPAMAVAAGLEHGESIIWVENRPARRDSAQRWRVAARLASRSSPSI